MQKKQIHTEEVINTFTHGGGMLFGIAAFAYLCIIAFKSGNPWAMVTFPAYGLCMLSSYITSTFYHASRNVWKKKFLRKLDHGAIYIHIAGTYTPFTLITLRNEGAWGWSLFTIVWLAAIIGICLSFFKMKKKNHFKTICYLAMGWVIVIAFKPLYHVLKDSGSMDVLYWLIAGGLSYTAGSIFFFLDNKYKYMHPVWHLFVLGGSICHFIAIALLV